MRRLWLVCCFMVLGCETLPPESAQEEAAIQPGRELRLFIPPAPPALPVRPWARGTPLIPAGVTLQSFEYVYAVQQTNPGVVQAAGFDVAAGIMLFNLEIPMPQVGEFLSAVTLAQNNSAVALESGGQGNLMPKGPPSPGGTYFVGGAWSWAYAAHHFSSGVYQP